MITAKKSQSYKSTWSEQGWQMEHSLKFMVVFCHPHGQGPQPCNVELSSEHIFRPQKAWQGSQSVMHALAFWKRLIFAGFKKDLLKEFRREGEHVSGLVTVLDERRGFCYKMLLGLVRFLVKMSKRQMENKWKSDESQWTKWQKWYGINVFRQKWRGFW